MKQHGTIAIMLCEGQAATLCETSNGLVKGLEKQPRLMIQTGSYTEEGAYHPPESICLYRDSVLNLYNALKVYYNE